MGRHERNQGADLIREVLTSLPAAHPHTKQSPPEDLDAGLFTEVQSGQDASNVQPPLWQLLIAALFWVGWIGWTTYIWVFSGSPISDLGIAIALCLLTFAFTIVGVPVVRRVARNRGR